MHTVVLSSFSFASFVIFACVLRAIFTKAVHSYTLTIAKQKIVICQK